MKPGTEKNLLQTLVGLAVVLLGLGLALGAVSIPSAAGYAGIGPNFLPWVVALALILVVVSWISLHHERDAAPTDVQVSRSLLFRDMPGCDILIVDVKTGEQVARVQG